jgi:hypothetical protein
VLNMKDVQAMVVVVMVLVMPMMWMFLVVFEPIRKHLSASEAKPLLLRQKYLNNEGQLCSRMQQASKCFVPVLTNPETDFESNPNAI